MSESKNILNWDDLRQLDDETFSRYFETPEQCLEFLAELKWKDGFVCRKCGHTHYCKGKTAFARRCTRCKSEESATAHTMFHRCKIHLPEAFNIMHTVCQQPAIPTTKISDQLEMRLMTCWRFRKKVMECLTDRSSFTFLSPVEIKTRPSTTKKK